jgi:flagellar hook-associated protein 3 FlgL
MTPLPLSTGLFYGRSKAQMGTLTAQADRLQTQIATTKKYQVASDNSVAYQRLQRLQRQNDQAGAYDANLDTAASLLQQTDTTLGSMADQVGRASELVLRAQNGTLDATARKALGAELTEIVDTLVQLANTADTRGQPLMGGADGDAAVTRGPNGTFVYAQGAAGVIPVGDDQAVAATESAARVFEIGGGKDMLAVLSALAGRLSSGDTLDKDDAEEAVDDLKAATDQMASVRGSVGARAARVDLLQSQSTALATDREAERSSLEDTDMAAAIADLQQTMTVLSATQASFSKLSQLSLFDYLR